MCDGQWPGEKTKTGLLTTWVNFPSLRPNEIASAAVEGYRVQASTVGMGLHEVRSPPSFIFHRYCFSHDSADELRRGAALYRKYADNYDRIFGKKKGKEEEGKQDSSSSGSSSDSATDGRSQASA